MNAYNPRSILRGHIREMPPYQPIHPCDVLSEQLGIPEEELVKLDANENPYGVLPQVSEALSTLSHLHLYPDPESRFLRRDLAELHGIPPDRILTGAGADELIDLILRVTLDPGDLILNCPPTFSMYEFNTDVNNARTLNVPRRKDFSLDLAAVEAAVQEHRPKLLFLASPNNPDGGLLPRSELKKLLKLPLVVVVDEAYINFAPDGSTALNLITAHRNLIVLRTFSKWAGLAGLRVGYGFFPGWITPALWKVKQPYNVNAAAAAAARITLQHRADLGEQTGKIRAERGRLYEGLQELDWLSPYPSQANFILCRVNKRDAAEVKDALSRRGILVRYFHKPGLTDHIRISVGKTQDTIKLLQALQAI